MAEKEYDFESGVLHFNIDPFEMDPNEQELAIAKAIHPKIAAPFIDITCTNYIASETIGRLTAAASTCLEDGRHLTVLAQKNVAMMLERTGFAKVGNIKKASE